ncbi:hypothetical protein [Sagittula sp. S175]|uniref:hypothetical protein n=1 Tax=Sagittula sp. S175 TaxID=3415129 RepID=UPI003C79CD9C
MRVHPAIFALVTLATSPAAADPVAQCMAGDSEACLQAARTAQADGDEATGYAVAEKGCALGNSISCADKGLMLMMGRAGDGSDATRAEGVALIETSCADGYFRACANMGYLHYTGTILPQDTALAAGFYEQGCAGGSRPACENLALMVAAEEIPASALPDVLSTLAGACALGVDAACL